MAPSNSMVSRPGCGVIWPDGLANQAGCRDETAVSLGLLRFWRLPDETAGMRRRADAVLTAALETADPALVDTTTACSTTGRSACANIASGRSSSRTSSG